MKKYLFILFFGSILTIGCKNDDNNTPQEASVTLQFTHNWDGTAVTSSDFNTTEYTTANDDVLKLTTKMRYLISKIILTNSSDETFELAGYNLVDLKEGENLSFTSATKVPTGSYKSISFVFGFDETDNVSDAYTDLNVTNWNWPSMLGGGYHFMQMEGTYNGTNTFAYHMGTARPSMGVFEDNHFTTTLDLEGVIFTGNPAIEIKMDIANWFENPNTWDLSTYNNMLMPNYDAQIMMHENGEDVFSLGVIRM